MQLNQQDPEPQIKGEGHVLDLHSIFLTIQGEGPFAGRPAVFVRLAGCNLQCPGCDTEYTQGRRLSDDQHIALEVNKLRQNTHANLVVITGGEPLRQNIAPLCTLLVHAGFTVQIESNGVLPVSGDLQILLMTGKVHLIVSPKTSRIHPSVAKLAMAFKYVLRATDVLPDDGLPTRALMHKASPYIARPPAGYELSRIYVNPMDEQDQELNTVNLAAVIRSCQQFGYTAGIQLHKLMRLA